MAKIKIGAFTPALYQDVTANPASMASAAVGTTTLTVPGAQVGEVFLVIAQSAEAGLMVDPIGRCTTAGQVVVRHANLSGGVLDPAAQTFTVIGL